MNQPMPPDGSWNPGQPTTQGPVVPGPGPVPGAAPVPGPTPPTGGSGNRTAKVAVIAVLATLVVVGVVLAAFLLGRNGGDDTTTTGDTRASDERSTTTSTTTTAAPTTAAPATAVPTTLGDVRSQPAGLFCRDLRAMGFSYPAAVDYWRVQGQPERLDADRDGIPCETVYPTSDVVAYWGTQGVTPSLETSTVYDLGPGLKCQDLADMGYSVYEAIDYYLNWGGPSNMDADGNGIPCETVYADAYDVWVYGYGD